MRTIERLPPLKAVLVVVALLLGAVPGAGAGGEGHDLGRPGGAASRFGRDV